MLYKFFLSKKGFTLTELMVVATILGILTAIAVPVFGAVMHQQRLSDCKNQCTVISTTVRQAMYGMMDSGKRQPKIIFSKADATRVKKFDGKTCFVLTGDDKCFTLGDLRGGYRSAVADQDDYPNYNKTEYTYNDGCAYDEDYVNSLKAKGVTDADIPKEPKTNPSATCFLKKEHLANKPFYEYLDNMEVPVCPFADYEDEDDNNNYYYYVLEDGSVRCSNPECNEED